MLKDVKYREESCRRINLGFQSLVKRFLLMCSVRKMMNQTGQKRMVTINWNGIGSDLQRSSG